MILLKKHIILKLVNSYIVDSPQPANILNLLYIGSLLSVNLLTVIFLANYYQIDFNLFREVNNEYTSISNSILFLSCNLKSLKEFNNKILNHYFNLIKLETGYKSNNKYLILLIIFISITTLLLRNIIINTFFSSEDYSIILNILSFLIICNIIYIQFNLMLRITLILLKGLPYFKKEVKNNNIPYIKSYLIAYLIYNISLIFISYLILSNLYNFLSLYYSFELIKITYFYSLLFSYILYRFYFEYNWNNYQYKIEYKLQKTFRFIDKLLILILPVFIIFYIFSFLFINYGVINCQPPEGNSSTGTNINRQVNSNIQEFTISNKDSNITIIDSNILLNNQNVNEQYNKNIQVFQDSNAQTLHINNNKNIQDNINNQIHKTTPNTLSVDIDIYLKILEYHKTESFWDNISYLENLKNKGIFTNEFIQFRINMLIRNVIEVSDFNKIIFEINYNYNKSLGANTFYMPIYYYLINNPIYFNNTYEIANYSFLNNNFILNKIYSVQDCENLVSFYYTLKLENNFIFNKISSDIANIIYFKSNGFSNIYDNDLRTFIQFKFFDSYNKGLIKMDEDLKTFDLFGFNLTVFKNKFKLSSNSLIENHSLYISDNLNQLKFTIINDYIRLQNDWFNFIHSQTLIDIIKRDINLMTKYRIDKHIELNNDNLDLLSKSNYKNEFFYSDYNPYINDGCRTEVSLLLYEYRERFNLHLTIKDLKDKNLLNHIFINRDYVDNILSKAKSPTDLSINLLIDSNNKIFK